MWLVKIIDAGAERLEGRLGQWRLLIACNEWCEGVELLIEYFQTDSGIYRAQEAHIGQSWVWCLFLVTSGSLGLYI